MNQEATSLRDILNVPCKRWGIIATVLLVSLLVGGVYVLLAAPQYVATSKLLVQLGREKASALAADPQPMANMSFQERPQNINNEIEILRDPALMEQLLPQIKERLAHVESSQAPTTLLSRAKSLVAGLRDDMQHHLEQIGLTKRLPPDRALLMTLYENLGVDFTKETDVVNVRVRWTDPDFAAFVANLYVDAYQEKRIQIHGVSSSFDFYQEQLTASRQDLATVEEAVAEFLQSGKISNLDNEKASALAYITELDKELIQTRIALEDVRQKTNTVEANYKKGANWIETPDAGEGESGLLALDRSFVTLSTERSNLLARFSPTYPAVVSMDQQLRQLREQKFTGLQTLYRTRAAVLNEKIAALDSKSRVKKKELEQLGERTLEYDRLVQYRNEMQSQVAYYRKKVEDLKISEDLDSRNISSVKVISPATPPMLPSAPKKTLILVLAAFTGLFFGIALSVIAEFFNHTFRNEQDVRRVLGVPLLSTVPALRL